MCSEWGKCKRKTWETNKTGDFRNWGWSFFLGWTTREIVLERCRNISPRKYFGGTGTPKRDRDGSLQMDFFMLFATEFHMVKFEETKQTVKISWTFNCRNIFKIEYIRTRLIKNNIKTKTQRIFSFVEVRKPYHHLNDNLTIVSDIK